ncbi:hypothetical protein SRHO_G00175940 [Serrasalmus rhombeus]
MKQSIHSGRYSAMSCVKEECEDISVMEVSELKTEDEEVKEEAILQEDIKEEYKVEVKPFQKESGLKTEQETSSGDVLDPNDHLRIHTVEEPAEKPFSCSECGKVRERFFKIKSQNFDQAYALEQNRSVKMSCVKEECEDIGVMEASGVKTEDEEVEKGTI